ncbi:MAG: biotin attachment protein [Candidatus Omnitrophica bacterium]|nr:biotin attachment protein [Candidatus Omnitrophota bacterium]
MVQVRIPELGESIDKALVAGWHHGLGDAVRQDEDLLEVVTDKAVFNVPSPVSGRLKAIQAPKGQEVLIGEVVALMEEDG